MDEPGNCYAPIAIPADLASLQLQGSPVTARLYICLAAAPVLAILSGCSSSSGVGPADIGVFPPIAGSALAAAPNEEYRIGALDTLNVTVFQEPDMAVKEQPVSLAGAFAMPLLGEVQASGKTAVELSREIAAGLNKRYLRDARVSVAVIKSANYTFTVDGQVAKPGVYDIPGRITLSRAVALGEGATTLAKLDDVVIVRQSNAQTYAARFSLNDIRAARFPDPEIKQGDVVIVGYSQTRAFFRNVLGALPGAAGLFLAIR